MPIPFIGPGLIFIKSNWKILLLTGLIVGEYFFVSNMKDNEWTAKLSKERDKVVEQREKDQAKFDEEKLFIATAFEEYRRTHPKIEYRKVTEYVTKVSDANCSIPVGFVYLHEASLGREYTPNGGRQPYDSPSGVALSTVGEVVSDNYNTCLTEFEKLKALQATVRAYQKIQGAK